MLLRKKIFIFGFKNDGPYLKKYYFTTHEQCDYMKD